MADASNPDASAAAAASTAAAAPAHSVLSREIGPIKQPKGSFRQALPVWSSAPVAPYGGVYAEVYVTEGVILETRHLSKARGHTFGRHAEWCDQVLPKLGSISRQHAALVHTRSGPVLLDLFSSHGTTLNSTKLAAGQPYPLHEGDVARFGGQGSFYKFKGTGRPKREPGSQVAPIVPSANYKPEELPPQEGGAAAAASTTEAAAAAATSTAATAASSGSAGEKRKLESGSTSSSSSSSRKDARGESGSRLSSLPNPKTDRVRCRHLLVKHSGSRRPSSWREEHITCSKEEARAKLAGFRAQITAGEPSAAEMENRLIALAKVNSDCSSAKMGGDLGFFEFKKMQPPFSQASFQLRVGELSPIVESESGVHIIYRKE